MTDADAEGLFEYLDERRRTGAPPDPPKDAEEDDGEAPDECDAFSRLLPPLFS